MGVEVVDEEAQVVKQAQPRWHVAPADAGQQLLDREAGHAAVGGIDVELGDGAGVGLNAPSVGKSTGCQLTRGGLRNITLALFLSPVILLKLRREKIDKI